MQQSTQSKLDSSISLRLIEHTEEKNDPQLNQINEDLHALKRTCKALAVGIMISSLGITVLLIIKRCQITMLQTIFSIIQCAIGIFFGSGLILTGNQKNQSLLVVQSGISIGIAIIIIALAVFQYILDGKNNPEEYEALESSVISIYVILSVFQVGGSLLAGWFLFKIKQTLHNLTELKKPVSILNTSIKQSSPQARVQRENTITGGMNSLRGGYQQQSQIQQQQSQHQLLQTEQQKRESQKAADLLFENCSQFTESQISDIDNSIPGKKKKAFESMDDLIQAEQQQKLQRQQQRQLQKQQQQQTKAKSSQKSSAPRTLRYESLNQQIIENEDDSLASSGNYDYENIVAPVPQKSQPSNSYGAGIHRTKSKEEGIFSYNNNNNNNNNNEDDEDDIQFVNNTVRSQREQQVEEHFGGGHALENSSIQGKDPFPPVASILAYSSHHTEFCQKTTIVFTPQSIERQFL